MNEIVQINTNMPPCKTGMNSHQIVEYYSIFTHIKDTSD